jgi:hypothetical protein
VRQLSPYVSRQIAGCTDGPCPNWYELVSGDYMFQGDELPQADGLTRLPGQALIRVPRQLIRDGLAEVQALEGASAVWVELDADNLAFCGERIDDAALLAGIEVSPGETFIRVDRNSITTRLAEVAA